MYQTISLNKIKDFLCPLQTNLPSLFAIRMDPFTRKVFFFKAYEYVFSSFMFHFYLISCLFCL